MNNIVVLQKTEDGQIHCRELSEKGIEFHKDEMEDEGYWNEGGTILLDELDKILSKQR